VTDPVVHERVKLEIAEALVVAGAPPFGWIDSPLLGADGNREFLVHARPVPPATGAA
jgi:23S rRNA (cytidine1920-2'-O)/16S rRNA (cytidine1409-2'-O)-methyltransferase